MSLIMHLPRARSESGKARGKIYMTATGLVLDIDESNPASIEEYFDTEAASFGLQCSSGCSAPFLLPKLGQSELRDPESVVLPDGPLARGPTLLDLAASGLYANALLCLAANPNCLGARHRRMILARIEWEMSFHGTHQAAYESLPTSQPSRDIKETRHFDRICAQMKLWAIWHLRQQKPKSRDAIRLVALVESRLTTSQRWASELPQFDADFGSGLEFHGPHTIAWRAGNPSDCMIPQEAELLVRRDLPDQIAIDLFDVRHLTPDAAAILAQFQGNCNEYSQTRDGSWTIEDCNPGVCIDRLETLTLAAAEALAAGSTPSLSLRGLKYISSDALAALRKFRGQLYLPEAKGKP